MDEELNFHSEQIIQKQQDHSGWRMRSLNANPIESYQLSISPGLNTLKNILKVQAPSIQKEIIVFPKITKINNSMFTILMNNQLSLYIHMSHEERASKKINKSYHVQRVTDILLPNNIQYVIGNDTNIIYVSSCSQILAIEIINFQGQITFKEIFRRQISEIRGISSLKTNLQFKLIVLTTSKIIAYNIQKNYQLRSQIPITFSSQSTGLQDISSLVGIDIIAQNPKTFYYLGSAQEKRSLLREKLGRGSDQDEGPKQKKCQALYITKISINKGKAEARIFIIDFIFQIGIFRKSRVFQAGPQTFILSLYEQIIVIKKKFTKFMVWDNVSLVASKSNQKKGQLALAQRIMVYAGGGQISSHQLYFDLNSCQFKHPHLDTVKGNDNDQQIMYDALIFQEKPGSYINVLFFFKQNDIDLPNHPRPTVVQEQKNRDSIKMSILVIQQTNPTEKLKQLLLKNKNPEQIDLFLHHFNIDILTYEKCVWEVSLKGQKQIQSILLEINDNNYIQKELTQILKQNPHQLQFLITIQHKQGERYKKMLAYHLLKLRQNPIKPAIKSAPNPSKIINQQFNPRQISQIKNIISWLLQSQMFQKKLKYSQNFLSFKEYDFIQIGKLKAASLREEIKLLGCKGFQRRLKYFLNSFKYLILDDFQVILRFFLEDMNQKQLTLSLSKSFPFLLPLYIHKPDQDLCKLWEDNFEDDLQTIITPNMFKLSILKQIDLTIKKFPEGYIRIAQKAANENLQRIFEEFIGEKWFKKNSYKQHCLLKHSIPDLKKEFKILKDGGVCNIIVKMMFEKIEANQYKLVEVRKVIQTLTKQKMFDQKFTDNINARLEVYDYLKTQRILDYDYNLPKKPQFIGMNQMQHFSFLFKYFKKHILPKIYPIYIKYGNNLFIDRFKIFLQSDGAVLYDLIDFLNFFNDSQYDPIKFELFTRICQLLKTHDLENSNHLFSLLLEKQIVFTGQFTLDRPIMEAKVMLINSFAILFNHFQIDNSYYELAQQTFASKMQDALILSNIIEKYCKNFDAKLSTPISFDKNQFLEDIPVIDLSEVLDFIATLLYYKNIVDLQISEVSILHKVIWEFLQNQKYSEISQFMDYLLEFGRSNDEKKLAEEHPHYALLGALKRQHNLKRQLQEVVMRFTDIKYQLLQQNNQKKEETLNISQQLTQQASKAGDNNFSKNSEKLEKSVAKLLFQISSSLKVLNKYTVNEAIKKSIHYLSMLENIKNLDLNLMLQVLGEIRKNPIEFSKQSNFIFLKVLIKKIDSKIFDLDEYEPILQQIKCLRQISKDFIISQKGTSYHEQLIVQDFCRFHSEFIVYLIDHKLFKPSAYNLFQLINTQHYYRDIVFYMLARIIDSTMSTEKVEQVVYAFMTASNYLDLTKNFDLFLVTNKISNFSQQEEYSDNAFKVFECILLNNQLDQAFFSLLRNQSCCMKKAEQIAGGFQKYKKQFIITHSLLIHYMVILKDRTSHKNFPTFEMYKSKFSSLCKDYERMSIIKDIYLVKNQMEIQMIKKKDSDSVLKNKHNILKQLYQQYMNFHGLEPQLMIGFQEEEQSNVKIEKFAKKSAENEISIVIHHADDKKKAKYYEDKEIIEQKRKLLQNEHRLRQINQRNKALMELQLQPAITNAKKQVQQKKQGLSLLERKQLKHPDGCTANFQKQIKEQNQELQKLFLEQAERIKQIKETYQSKTVLKAREFMQELRKKRMQVRQQLGISTKPEDISHSIDNSGDNRKGKFNLFNLPGLQNTSIQKDKSSSNLFPIKPAENSRVGGLKQSMIPQGMAGSRMFNINFLKSSKIDPKQIKNNAMKQSFYRSSTIFQDKNSQYYIPKRQIKQPSRLDQDSRTKEELKNSMYIQKMKRQLQEQRNKQKKIEQKSKMKMTLAEIIAKYSIIEKQIVPLLQKLEYAKNSPKTGIQIMKSIYTKASSIENFIKVANDLLENLDYIKEILEEKAVKILEQATKFQAKLPLKDIFPATLFVSIKHIPLRDYYHIAYGIIKPNLITLMQDTNLNVNNLSVMVRYAFGFDNTFYYKVYQEYTRSILNRIQKSGDISEKDSLALTQKLLQNFNSLHADNRAIKFQQLLMEVKSNTKRSEIISNLYKNIERKSSLANKQGLDEIKMVLAKIK